MTVGLNSRNRYAAIMRVTNAAGFLVEKEHLDIRPTLVAINFADNKTFTADQRDSWSRIAWRKLGESRLWWIIADFSQIVDAFSELKPTTQKQYVTQLTQNVAAGTVNQIVVADPKKIRMSMNLFVENLDPANPTNFSCSVLEVNQSTGVVLFTPVTCPAPGIPFSLSRVSQVKVTPNNLVCPSVHTAFFESLNFANPLNTLVQ